MAMIDRIKNILITPKTEWDVIDAEPTPPKQVIIGYAIPLVVVSALAAFISASVIGHSSILGGTFRVPMMWGLVLFVYHLVAGVASVLVLAFIVDALAPTFAGQKSFPQAVKVVAYSYTAAVVGSVLGILPYLGFLLALLLGLYCIYLLYLGLPRLMKSPPDKAIAYTAVTIVVAIVVFLIIGFISTLIMAPAMIGAAHMSRSPEVTYDRSSPAGKMQEFGKKMEEQTKRMEAAQKSGDPNKQAEAAMGALGTMFSGGKGVEPVQTDALKPLIPATFAGLPQTSTESSRNGVPGLMVAKAGASYGDGSAKRARLELVDTGGAAALTTLAAWSQGEREDATRREATRKEGNRIIHEEVSKTGGHSKYTMVLADRFVVSAEGDGVEFGALKAAVTSLDLGKIESLK